MVKKSGILDKLVGRFRAGSAVRVDSGSGAERAATKGPLDGRAAAAQPAAAQSGRPNGPAAQPIRAAQVPVQHVPEEIIPASKRKLSTKENAQITIDKSFQELSTLLRGVQNRMENQGSKLDRMNENVAKLPAAAHEQVELLRSLVTQLDKQNSMNGKMVETFAELPAVMKGVQESLARSAATDHRTAKTLDDFKGTMDRIQGSIGDMVSSSQKQATAVTDVAKDQRETVQALTSATQDGLEALRKAQEDQANRMAKIASENGRSNRVVVVLLILSFAAMVAILAAMVGRG